MRIRSHRIAVSLLPALIALAVILQGTGGCTGQGAPGIEEVSASAVPESLPKPVPVNTLYGIPVDSFRIFTGQVRWGQSLADILSPYGVSPQQVYQISLLPDSVLNERKIRPGFNYTFFSTLDSLPAVFVYEKDPLSYVVVRFDGDGIRAETRSKKVVRQVRMASGTIETSLWEAMIASGTDPMLAVELSEIFAWSIDFFGIQEGDRYKVIYEESYVDSQSIGINRILGAWFLHSGTEFWAIPFEQDGVRSFFDENGNSLRKAFLKAPLRFSRISSGFSSSRYHPVLKIRRPHHGVDYAAPTGTPVHSVGDGLVTQVGYQRNGGGNYVKIKHNSVYSTTYMHLSRFGKGIRSGTYVKQGDVIGYVGATGLATGPHLDFRFYRNGSAVNPLTVEAPPVEPVTKENLNAYAFRKKVVMGALKLI
jgi:murein DD-endopeptidase MepM/ murein hydrolase activator NlpD